MKFSILSVLWRRYSLEHAFQVASRCGYDGIDICGSRPHAYPYDMDAKRIEEVIGYKEKYHLEIPAYCMDTLAYPFNPASRDKVERDATTDMILREVDVAAEIGIEKVQFTAGHAGYDTVAAQNRENLYSVLAPIVERAEQKKVIAVLEPVTIMESNVTAFVDDIREILDHVSSPWLKTMMDTVTPPVNKETYSEHFEKLGKDIVHMHFIDSNNENEAHLLLGTGKIDLPALVDTIRFYGYDGWVVSEIISQGYMQPDIIAHRELRYMKELFKEG